MRGNRQVSSHFSLHPLEKARSPRQAGAKTRQQNVVAALDASLADRLLKRDRDRCTGSVSVLVDVDGDSVQRQSDPSRSRVDDLEVGLVRNPEIDVFHRDPGGATDFVRLADEDVNRELEDVWTLHLDDGPGVLRGVGAEFLVATGNLEVTASIAAQAPGHEAGARRGWPHHGRTCAIAEDHSGAAI